MTHVLVGGVLLACLSGCVLNLQDPKGRKCDADHPCGEGRTCRMGNCVDANVGGGAGGGNNDGGTGGGTGGGAGGGATGGGSGGGPCVPGSFCTSTVGLCVLPGQTVCSSGVASCDAPITADAGTPCPLTAGVCAGRQLPCGASSCNYGSDYETVEVSCDGLDNDCDGTVDDVRGCVLTLAGASGWVGYADSVTSADEARLSQPQFLFASDGGYLLFIDTDNHAIRKTLLSNGLTTTLAGGAIGCPSVDGPAGTGRVCNPTAVLEAVDRTVYFTETTKVRAWSAGVLTTVSGTDQAAVVDGTKTLARFASLAGIAREPNGDLLVSESSSPGRVRRVKPDGTTTTEWGGGDGGLTAPADNLTLFAPRDLATASDGTRYLLQTHLIHRLPADGGPGVVVAGASTNANTFNAPRQLALDEARGRIYVADTNNHVIRQVPLDGGQIINLLGNTSIFSARNGPANDTRLWSPTGVVLFRDELFVVDKNNMVRAFPLDGGVMRDLAGPRANLQSVDGDKATGALVQRGFEGFDLGTDGHLYFPEFDRQLIRRMRPDGTLETVSGALFDAGVVDGTLAQARFNFPRDIKRGPDGKLYVADNSGRVVHQLDLDAGVSLTWTGSGTAPAGFANGSIGTALYSQIAGLAFGKLANGRDVLFINDRGNGLIRVVDLQTQMVSNFAGTAFVAPSGNGGDSSAADAGQIGTSASHLVSDPGGGVVIAEGQRLRRANGTSLRTFALNPTPPNSITGLAREGNTLFFVYGRQIGFLDLSNANPTTYGTLLGTGSGMPIGFKDGTVTTGSAQLFNGIVVFPEALWVGDLGRIRRVYR